MSTINLTKNLVHHSRTAHIKMKHHFIINYIAWGDIIINYIVSKSNLMDIFTKPFPKVEFNTLHRELCMCFID